VSQVRSRAGWLLPAALVGVGVVVLGVVGGDGGEVPALDPRSDARLGTSALAALLGELGAEVDVSDELPGDDTDVAVLFTDLLEADQQAALDDWVRAGGTLVVADPGSTFTPSEARSFADAAELADRVGERPPCDLTPLDGLDLGAVDPRNGGVLYDVPARGDACLGDGEVAYLVAMPTGEGDVVAVGGAGMFVNAALAEGENAPVVAALVAPSAGTRVTLLRPGPLSGGGTRTLGDLIAPNVRRALAQLGIAFVLFALWRSRRLGAPVDEPQPVAVAGSELVAAVGSLLDRSRSPQHAAELLRADLRRFLGDRLGVPPEAPPAVLAAVAAERVGADRDRVGWALGPGPVADDDQLVALAQTIDAIRQEVLDHV
jgi:hypothetical protein